MVIRTEGYQSQIYDTVEGPKPGMRIRSRGSYRFNTFKVETACAMGERAGGVREGFHPRFKVGCVRIEPDTVEKMSSGPRDPRLGDEGTRSKRSWFTNQMVRDEVEDLGWESGRHRGPLASSVSHGPLFHDLRQSNSGQISFFIGCLWEYSLRGLEGYACSRNSKTGNHRVQRVHARPPNRRQCQ